jgi:hypothetical protein
MNVPSMAALVQMLLVLGAGPPASSAASSKQRFDLDSTDSTYPFVMRLQGTMELRGDTIVINVERGLVHSAIPKDLSDEGEARDIRITFGVGEKTADGWTMTHDSEDQVVASGLSPDETRSLGSLHYLVSDLSTVSKADTWLVARLTVTQHLPGVPAGFLSSYGCSQVNFLGATKASRERAKGMKTAYSKIC